VKPVSEELVWTEKYRPKKLDDIVGHDAIVLRLKQFVRTKNMPHCLFVGPPGVGKTTAAMCLAREMLGEHFAEGYLELNASDERGIDVVREQVKEYARSIGFGGIPFKILVLDEADSMTPEAQHALRRTMELFSDRCRFILIGNYSSRIIEPIQSRCALFRFSRISKEDVVKRLEYIAKQEGVEYEREGLEMIYEESEGDLRMCINALQSLASLGKRVDKKNVSQVLGLAYAGDVSAMINMALSGKFEEARKSLQDILYTKAVAPEDILRQIYREVTRSGLPDHIKASVLEVLGDSEFRITEGADPEIQLNAFLAKAALLSKASGNEQ
jgi:replication factor C small subunit